MYISKENTHHILGCGCQDTTIIQEQQKGLFGQFLLNLLPYLTHYVTFSVDGTYFKFFPKQKTVLYTHIYFVKTKDPCFVQFTWF